MGELDVFKREINLSEYAASQGYRIDRKASSRNSVVMRSDAGDKIVIARGEDGHWIYFSVRDERDNGTIVDFVQRRKGVKLGGVRQELRPWAGAIPHGRTRTSSRRRSPPCPRTGRRSCASLRA